MAFKGHCLCGAVEYECQGDPVAFMLCHCRDCQYISGGEPAAVVVVPKAAFMLTKGRVKDFRVIGDTGSGVVRQFCPECGTPMFSMLEANPGLWAIKAGTMDDPSWLTPTAFLWAKSAQPWSHKDPNIHAFDKQPVPQS